MTRASVEKPLHFLTIAEAAPLIASGSLSPVTLIEAFLKRIAEVDPLVSSFVELRAEAALADARICEQEIAAGRYRGPLHGIPYGIKDNIAAKGMPWVANSRLRLGMVAEEDAEVQSRLARAGAILLGKLNTYELGTGNGDNLFELINRPARNPWDLERFSGGSTTGAGVAVASGTAMFAIGTDTGGSVRLPAAACGAAGLKPTYGSVSGKGIIPNCYSLDHTGPIAWTAEDLQLILPAIASGPAAPVPSAPLRVAVIGRFHEKDANADPEIGRGIADAVAALERLGAEVTEIEFPHSLAQIRACGRIINAVECLSIGETDYRERAALIGKAVRDKLAFGDVVSGELYVRAQRWRRRIIESVEAVFAEHDVIVSCGTTITAPRYEDERKLLGAFTTTSATSLYNITGHPAISVCSGFSTTNGMPLNVQIAGPRYGDAALLAVAARLETALGLRVRRPELDGVLPPPAPSWASEPPLGDVSREEMIRAAAECAALLPPTLPPELGPAAIGEPLDA